MTRATRRRRGAVAALLALSGAAALAGAAFLPWWRRDYDDALTGPMTVSVDGAAVWAALVPVALVIAAGYGAAALSPNLVRRAIGVVLAGLGLVTIVVTVRSLAAAPQDAFVSQLIRPATPAGEAILSITGPILALVGAVSAAAAGLLIATGPAPNRSRTYDSPAARHEAAPPPAPKAPSAAVDGYELWRALDDGDDPTADAPPPTDEVRSSPPQKTDTMGQPDSGGR